MIFSGKIEPCGKIHTTGIIGDTPITGFLGDTPTTGFGETPIGN